MLASRHSGRTRSRRLSNDIVLLGATDGCPAPVAYHDNVFGGDTTGGCPAHAAFDVIVFHDATGRRNDTVVDDATGGCEACPAGTYQPQAKNTVGASSCIACSAGMDAPEPGSALCCSEDYVLVGQKCAKCGVDDGDYKLTGTKCDTPETRTVATLEIEKGFLGTEVDGLRRAWSRNINRNGSAAARRFFVELPGRTCDKSQGQSIK